MKLSTDFRGRVIQVVEALDVGDAVSNQVIALDDMLRDMGLQSVIVVKWMHSDVRERCKTVDQVALRDDDIVIYHSAGFSEHTCKYVLGTYCTRVLLYHNITPHDFFEEGSTLYEFCKKGRQQLAEIVPHFHAFWADSQYNLEELISLGAPIGRSHVIPIVVPCPEEQKNPRKDPGSWLFVGRIAANKGQVDLVKAFLAANRKDPSAASKLYLVGGYQEGEPYYDELAELIREHDAGDKVVVTGKIGERRKEDIFRKAAVMVSFSSHEGFGVPLVEAPLHGTPVVAVSGTAVDETMGGRGGIARNAAEARKLAMRVASDAKFSRKLLAEQQANAARFEPSEVRGKLESALKQIIPARDQFTRVSVVICTYNRCADLERCLDYLSIQTSPSFEVVVVDGPSTDGTKELLAKYEGRIKVAHNPERNLSVSRNLGADIAAGEIVAYIDDDAIPFADWVQTLLREFNRRSLMTAGVGGPAYFAGSLRFQVEDIAFNRFAETIANVPSEQIGKEGWYRSLLGTNTAFSREHLCAVDGFDEQFDYFLDESDLTFRMQRSGSIVAYCPDLYLRHEFARSDNRRGRHTFNWFSICKNTAYFIALYSGITGEQLREYIKQRLQAERVAPLDAALRAGEIDKKLHSRLVSEIWRGMEQGLADSKRGPLTRPIGTRPPDFLPFQTRSDFPRVGVETERLHVCIISKEFPPFGASGGIGTLYYHLASELLLLGHEVTVVMPATSSSGRYDQGRFHIRYVDPTAVEFGANAPATASNLSWSLCAAAAVAEIHEERFIDIVESALWDTEALAFALIEKPRPPIVVRLVTPFAVASESNRWSVPGEVSEQYIAAEKSLISHADAVVGISKSITETITKQYRVKPDERWSISHCGIAYWPFFDWHADYDELGGERGIRDFVRRYPKTILFLGRLETRKGIDTLLEAAAEFLRGSRDAGLIISGKDIEAWEDKARKLLPATVRSKVLFTGPVSDATREKLMARAYCLVFPSRYESFGLVPLEAFVHGVPVVAARAGAVPEVVEEGVSGLLFDPADAHSLAGTVKTLIADPDLHQSLSDGARAAIRRFSGRNSAIRAIQLYVSLISNKRIARPIVDEGGHWSAAQLRRRVG